MSKFEPEDSGRLSRRDILKGAAAATVFCVLDCDTADAQLANNNIQRALDDPHVEHGFVQFQGGHDAIDGYLARPKSEGQYPVVLVITGNTLTEEYIQNTTAMLAQAGFVGFAPNIFSLQKDGMSNDEKRRVFAEEITDARIYADLFASLTFLRSKPFVREGKIGVMGFCFGGRCALMFSTQCVDVAAVAPFYGNLKTPDYAKRDRDPVDVVGQITAAVQGHYSKTDKDIPLPQLAAFGDELKKQNPKSEMFTYDAPHGFFAYTRGSYQAEAANLAWKRTSDFFHQILNG
jgi:carboxymethylenebutenolidase